MGPDLALLMIDASASAKRSTPDSLNVSWLFAATMNRRLKLGFRREYREMLLFRMQLDATDSDTILSGIGAEVKRRRSQATHSSTGCRSVASSPPDVRDRAIRWRCLPASLRLSRSNGFFFCGGAAP
jgi:hypothetical protein